jgi:hypothetical protein
MSVLSEKNQSTDLVFKLKEELCHIIVISLRNHNPYWIKKKFFTYKVLKNEKRRKEGERYTEKEKEK